MGSSGTISPCLIEKVLLRGLNADSLREAYLRRDVLDIPAHHKLPYLNS
jgi:hypothetical protein